MKRLPKWIERQLGSIRMSAEFGSGMTEPDIDNVDQWLDIIELHLSPESLCGDGELSGSSIQTKRRELLTAKKYCLNLKKYEKL